MLPEVYKVQDIRHDTPSVFTLTLQPAYGDKSLPFFPGQFNMLTHYGFGEVAISISGDPAQNDALVHTIQAVGSVTNSMQKLKAGDEVGVRGPFGTGWPLTKRDCDVLVIAGGLGFAPLRPALYYLAAHARNYRRITLLYGTRTPNDLLFQGDMEIWREQGIHVEATVDHADMSWRGHVGVVTALIGKNLFHPDKTLVLACGPEIMLKFAMHELMRAQADPANVYLSMERNMQCAVGFCGHCQLGPYFLCKDGPVFSYAQLKPWLPIKEL
jgi:NAD(P)H-flavin reductase